MLQPENIWHLCLINYLNDTLIEKSAPLLLLSFLLFTLFTTSGFCCFSFTYSAYLRHASANSHFIFRLLCFTQVLLWCKLLFSLSRSSELSFLSGPAFLLILVIIRRWLFTPKAHNFECFFFLLLWRAR